MSEAEILAFCRARLDDEERLAADADLSPARTTWYSVADLVASHHEGGAGLNDFDAEHVAHHDPKRVLLAVEADRAILDDLEQVAQQIDDGTPVSAQVAWLAGRTLRRLASRWSWCEDYRTAAWKP